MWSVYQPVEVIFGEGSVESIGDVLEAKGCERAFVVSSPSSVRNGVADRIRDLGKGRVVGVSADVHPDASVEDVDGNVAKALELSADCIIGLGGGSAMDCAKGVAVCAKQGLSASDIIFGIENVDALPIIMVPTTAGTGSEVTQGASITDKVKNIPGGIDGRFATVAIVDPELTYTLPKSVTINSGFDALGHALDALCRHDLHPYSRQLAVCAAKGVLENLEKVVERPDDKDARRNMMEASLLAGLACSQTGLAGPHACGMVLGGMFHLPHGAAVAFTMDRWLRLNAAANPKIDGYAQEIGFADANALADRIVEMKVKFGMPQTLTDLGANEGAVEPLAQGAAANFFGWMAGNCAPQSLEQMREFYRAML